MKKIFAKWGLVYPVHALRGEWIPLFRQEIKKSDFLESDALLALQQTKLARLIRNCHRHGFYYGEAFEESAIWVDGNYSADCLRMIPFLTKDIIRKQAAAGRKSPSARLDHRSTSGSTGTPITFFKDRLATAYMEAVQNHVFSWHGIDVGEPQGRFWGMPTGKKQRIAQFKDLLKNRIRFSAFDLSNEAKFAYYKRLMRFRPTYFYGYPSLIIDFARFLRSEKLSVDSIPLKAIISTGEYLYPHEREELEEVFGVRCVNEYGCSEIGLIGFDCPQGKMHLMASNVIVEILDDEGSPVPHGDEGELVVTELNSRYFPFIRYKIGDRGRFTGERCDCGRTLPVIAIAAGRKDDYIVTPEGRRVYDAILAYTLKDGVAQFQAVQDRIDRLRIFIVPEDSYTENLENKYRSILQDALSPTILIEFIRVREIERERSSKLRYFRSEVGKSAL